MWEERTNARGYNYWQNRETGEISWDAPQMEAEISAKPPPADDDVVHASSWEGGHGGTSAAAAATTAAAAAQQGGDGWQMYTNEDGYVYYFNAHTGESVWADDQNNGGGGEAYAALRTEDDGHSSSSSEEEKHPYRPDGDSDDDSDDSDDSDLDSDDESGSSSSGASTDSNDEFEDRFRAMLATPEGRAALEREQATLQLADMEAGNRNNGASSSSDSDNGDDDGSDFSSLNASTTSTDSAAFENDSEPESEADGAPRGLTGTVKQLTNRLFSSISTFSAWAISEGLDTIITTIYEVADRSEYFVDRWVSARLPAGAVPQSSPHIHALASGGVDPADLDLEGGAGAGLPEELEQYRQTTDKPPAPVVVPPAPPPRSNTTVKVTLGRVHPTWTTAQTVGGGISSTPPLATTSKMIPVTSELT